MFLTFPVDRRAEAVEGEELEQSVVLIGLFQPIPTFISQVRDIYSVESLHL